MGNLRPLLLLFLTACVVGALGPFAAAGAPGGGGGRTGDSEREQGEPLHVAPGECRICALCARCAVPVLPLGRPRVYRCTSPEPRLAAVYPSGLVRAEDVGRLRIDVSPDWEPDGALEFRVNGDLVARKAFDPTYSSTQMELPSQVFDRLLEEGGELEWGWVPRDPALFRGEMLLKRTARLCALSGRSRHRLRAVGDLLAPEAKYVAHVVRGLFLFDQSYDSGALEQAQAALALAPDEPHALESLA